MQYELTTSCTAADLAPLKAGDTVLLSGVVYTARDQAHKRMLEALDKGEKLPFDLEGSAIYYVGPTPERPGEVIGSAGPTTSGRMDAMSPRLLDLGNKIMIGKGKRDAAVKEAVVRSGAVYLAALCLLYTRQGQAGRRRQRSRRPQRRGLSGCAGRCRCADGPERQDAGSHRVARPRLRGRPPSDRGKNAPDGHPRRPRRRPLHFRPGGLSRDGKVTKLCGVDLV